MKLLRITDNIDQFLTVNGDHAAIDKISKDDLLRLVGHVLDEEQIEMDAYGDQAIKNQAYQVIYKSVYQKLIDLRNRRKEFTDESSRLFLETYESYRE